MAEGEPRKVYVLPGTGLPLLDSAHSRLPTVTFAFASTPCVELNGALAPLPAMRRLTEESKDMSPTAATVIAGTTGVQAAWRWRPA